MKQLLVGGGVIDFATLHPIWAVLAVVVAVLVMRRAARAFGPGRQARTRRGPQRGEGEGRRPAATLIENRAVRSASAPAMLELAQVGEPPIRAGEEAPLDPSVAH